MVPNIPTSIQSRQKTLSTLTQFTGVPLSTSKDPLKCYFDSKGDWYHLLQPFKLEELCLDPLILVYRDFIRDDEIDVLIQESIPNLRKSQIGHEGNL